uniref:Sperm associated antigen 7 n=1 Tax=Leptobrachium leishanense TaxID=445787 RepID=A0A8C5MLM5_9ANUR
LHPGQRAEQAQVQPHEQNRAQHSVSVRLYLSGRPGCLLPCHPSALWPAWPPPSLALLGSLAWLGRLLPCRSSALWPGWAASFPVAPRLSGLAGPPPSLSPLSSPAGLGRLLPCRPSALWPAGPPPSLSPLGSLAGRAAFFRRPSALWPGGPPPSVSPLGSLAGRAASFPVAPRLSGRAGHLLPCRPSALWPGGPPPSLSPLGSLAGRAASFPVASLAGPPIASYHGVFSCSHDVVEVAGLTSFSFGDDEESRYVMIFKKEFAPSDEELDAYRKGEEWDPVKAETKRKLKEQQQKEAEEDAMRRPSTINPATDYKDKYSHLIGKVAAKDAAHTLQANKAYGCVPVANKRDTRSIEEAMNEIRAKKRLKAEDGDSASGSS